MTRFPHQTNDFNINPPVRMAGTGPSPPKVHPNRPEGSLVGPARRLRGSLRPRNPTFLIKRNKCNNHHSIMLTDKNGNFPWVENVNLFSDN